MWADGQIGADDWVGTGESWVGVLGCGEEEFADEEDDEEGKEKE